MQTPDNVDGREIAKFDRLSRTWWDPRGGMGALHAVNPLRTRFVLEGLTVSAPRILDVGCGAGLLAEALARSGAQVTGIDLAETALQVARQHARAQGLIIDYRCQAVEGIAQAHAGCFDAVTCLEMLEHVPDPGKIVDACARVLKPGGHAFFSSVNRTPKAFLFAVIGGEYILRLLPRGTHMYARLIKPGELKQQARRAGLDFQRNASLMYNPLTGRFHIAAGKEDVNYLIHFIKR